MHLEWSNYQNKWKSSIEKINGIHLHFITAGNPSDTPIIFLHGFPEFWFSWRKQIDFFVEKRFYVIVPDQRGYHLSDKPYSVSKYNLDILVKDLIGLMDTLHLKKCVLVGHDWGAGVAYWAGLRFPECFYCLGILQLPHPIAIREFIHQNPVQRKKMRYVRFFQIPFLPEYLLRKNHFRRLRHALTKFSVKHTFSEAELNEYVQSWQVKGSLRGMLNWYRASWRNPPTLPQDLKLYLPVKVFWGVKDFFMDVEMVQYSMRYLPTGEIEYFEDATHWIHHEIPEKINPKLWEFVIQNLSPQ